MNFKKIIASTATAALFGSAFVPVVFAAELEISGNGADSTNKIKLVEVCNSNVVQVNKTDATTAVSASASTGGNTASGNTGGDVTVDTGDATTSVTVTVTGGDNTATAPSCCDCNSETPSVSVTGNGADSYNKVKVVDVKNTSVFQKSKTKATTAVTAKTKTGKNKAKNNTGGSVEVKTGNAETTVDVEVAGGSSTLNP